MMLLGLAIALVVLQGVALDLTFDANFSLSWAVLEHSAPPPRVKLVAAIWIVEWIGDAALQPVLFGAAVMVAAGSAGARRVLGVASGLGAVLSLASWGGGMAIGDVWPHIPSLQVALVLRLVSLAMQVAIALLCCRGLAGRTSAAGVLQ